jgi:hypothetical protein
MPNINVARVAELIPHTETLTLHGHLCLRHTLRLDHSLELELWLTNSPELPPFYLLTSDGPPRFGAADPHGNWPHLVRQAGKFPLLTILREAAATNPPAPRECARWEVISIAPAMPDPELFKHPDHFLADKK